MTTLHFTVERDILLRPLQLVSAPLSNRPSMPILGHVLLQITDHTLQLTSTDLEIEMSTTLPLLNSEYEGSITVPAKKLVDICRSLPHEVQIEFQCSENRLTITSGRSTFKLATLPAEEFPNVDNWQMQELVSLPQKNLKQVMSAVHFSMANQDVRYFLNGMYFEVTPTTLRVVATDGHRLALSTTEVSANLPEEESTHFILPRKTVLELLKLLQENDEMIQLAQDGNNLRIYLPQFTLTTKLIDGRYPDYQRVIPQNSDKQLSCSSSELKQSLLRVAILSNDKFKGIRLNISHNQMILSANNPEKEEAEEIIDVNYPHDPIEIGFNVTYLLDILNTLRSDAVTFSLKDAQASIQIQDPADPASLYVVMPMRL